MPDQYKSHSDEIDELQGRTHHTKLTNHPPLSNHIVNTALEFLDVMNGEVRNFVRHALQVEPEAYDQRDVGSWITEFLDVIGDAQRLMGSDLAGPVTIHYYEPVDEDWDD